jgi:hypothetical protein
MSSSPRPDPPGARLEQQLLGKGVASDVARAAGLLFSSYEEVEEGSCAPRDVLHQFRQREVPVFTTQARPYLEGHLPGTSSNSLAQVSTGWSVVITQ